MANGVPDYYAHPNPESQQFQGVGPDIFVDSTPNLPPNPFPLLISQPVQGQYTGYGITVSYSFDEGLRWSPVAGPKPTGGNDSLTHSVFWRAHSGFCVKRVDWACRMELAPPPVPLPRTNDNEVLIYSHFEIPHREVHQDGNWAWTRAGSYFFALQTMPQPSDILYGAIIPLDTGSVTNVYLAPQDFLDGLIGPIPWPNGYGGGVINY